VPGHPYQQGFDLRLVPEKLLEPIRWQQSRMIFVNSMSDLFHEDVPADYIARVGEVMRRADWHLFQVLTKRHDRLRELLLGELRWMADLEHVAFGVSVEDRRCGLPRIRSLQDTPARLRFLSVEPLLADLGSLDLRKIDWVIVGGESGLHARPMLRDWAVNIRRQCRAQRVPFFFKQWGGTRKHETGRTLDGRTYDEFPLAFHRVRTRSSPALPVDEGRDTANPFQPSAHPATRCESACRWHDHERDRRGGCEGREGPAFLEGD
jgi:protein gp37